MKYSELTLEKNTFVDYPIESFSKWYDDNHPLLKEISKQLKSDLEGFSEQIGPNRLAFYQVRVKSRLSFIDKIESIRHNPKLLEKYIPAKFSKEFQPQDIIKDLIGGRFIFYFENDLLLPINYIATYPQFGVEDVKAYEVVPEDSPFNSPSKKILYERLKNIFPAFSGPEAKPSTYESYHMIIRYHPSYIEIRSLVPPISEKGRIPKKMEDPSFSIGRSEFVEFPIEIQIRTILQHTWAQVEHRLNYNLKKTINETAIEDSHFIDDFRCHKAILFSAEHHQRIIYNRFWDHRYRYFLKKEPTDLGNRLHYFSSEEKDKLSEINRELHTAENSIIYTKLTTLRQGLEQEYNEKFLTLSFKNGPDAWGRQRLILLLYGYLLLIGDEQINQKVFMEIKEANDLINEDYASGTIRFYEHIRSMDTQFRWHPNSTEDHRSFFSDPLVNYRCAGANLKVNNFRRGIKLLKEVIDEDYFKGFKNEGGLGNFLNKMHFYRRIGEYFSYLYFGDNCSLREDLLRAIENMQLAYEAEGPKDEKELLKERRKIVSNLITYSFFRYMYSVDSNITGFKEYLQGYKSISDSLYDEAEILKNKSIHSLQALAIFKYSENDIVNARRLISTAYEAGTHVIDKLRTFHAFVLKSVYDYFMNLE